MATTFQNRLQNIRLAVGGFAIFSAMAGCSSEYPVAPVSGRITMDGQPLAGANVLFQPYHPTGNAQVQLEGGRGMGSYAVTDDDGRFALKLLENDRTGAAVGHHRVQISIAIDDPADDAGPGAMANKVPERYWGPDTELTIEVPSAGSTEANFELTSDS